MILPDSLSPAAFCSLLSACCLLLTACCLLFAAFSQPFRAAVVFEKKTAHRNQPRWAVEGREK
jgi:hypothetical protein